MQESNDLKEICKLFSELRKTTESFLKLQKTAVKYRRRLDVLNERLRTNNTRKHAEDLREALERCKDLNRRQLYQANAFYRRKTKYKQLLISLKDLRKQLLIKRRYLLAAELELYAIRGIDQYEINPVFDVSLRTVQYHIAALRRYCNSTDEIPTNRIPDSIREAMLVSRAIKTKSIPGLPESVQTMIDLAPEKLLADTSIEDMDHRRTGYAALRAERTLHELSETSYHDLVRCQELIRRIGSFYGYLDKAADYFLNIYKTYCDLIREESLDPDDARLYDYYIRSSDKGYPQIADECGVTVYKLRSVVKNYNKRFERYCKTHH